MEHISGFLKTISEMEIPNDKDVSFQRLIMLFWIRHTSYTIYNSWLLHDNNNNLKAKNKWEHQFSFLIAKVKISQMEIQTL